MGAEDNVKTGDYLTIYRPLGTGQILDDIPGEAVPARDSGFQSEEYAAGNFPIKRDANPAKKPTGA